MIRSTLAIAGLSLRSAIRSKLVICLVVVLAAGLIAVPWVVRADGTLTGRIKVGLVYSLGFAAVVLALTTLWAACRLIADEIDGRQIHQLVVKPVRRFQVWLGKWLGLLALNAVLLGCVGLFVYGSVLWRMRTDPAPAPEKSEVRNTVLTARTSLAPRDELTSDTVHAALDRLVRDGQIPEDAPHDEAYTRVRRSMQRARSTAQPGESIRWVFDLPPDWLRAFKRSGATSATLQFHLSQHALDRKPITGRWFVGSEQEPRLYSVSVRNHMERTHRLVVPLAPESIGEGPIVVEFVNGDADVSHRAVFRLDRNIELLFREGGFGGNLTRALIILFCKIAALAALGLCVSAMFSFPVASFSAVSAMIMALLVHYLAATSAHAGGCGHDHGHGDDGSGWFLHAGESVGKALALAMEPVMRVKTLEPLADGLLIGRRETGRAVVLMLILYPGLFGLAAGAVLNARELGLPGRAG